MYLCFLSLTHHDDDYDHDDNHNDDDYLTQKSLSKQP